jgi:hypothetical protein
MKTLQAAYVLSKREEVEEFFWWLDRVRTVRELNAWTRAVRESGLTDAEGCLLCTPEPFFGAAGVGSAPTTATTLHDDDGVLLSSGEVARWDGERWNRCGDKATLTGEYLKRP